MEQLPFLQDNVAAMVAGNAFAAKWLHEVNPDLASVVNHIVHNPGLGLDWEYEDGKTLFSSIPPPLYYQEWGEDNSNPGDVAGGTVLVGCNLGYGLNQLLTNTPERHKIMVIEPNPEMLIACLGQTDYTPFLKSGRLFIVPPSEEALQQLIYQLDVLFLFGRITLRLDVPSQQMSQEYARWGTRCKNALENFSLEMATLRLRQDTMVGNELANYRRTMRDGSIKNMVGSGKGLSAVIYGAGPSLAHVAEDIATAPGHVLSACALQTMPAMQNFGITPTFCMAIDFTDILKKACERIDPEFAANVPLFYSTKMNPEVVAAYPGPTIPFWTLGGMVSHVRQNNEFVLDAAGNVSVSLMRFFHWLGVDQLLMVGQDFAWKGESGTHVAGHHAAHMKGTEKSYARQELQNADGETIYTSITYATAIRDMESDIPKLGLPVYNLYGGGAVIKGTRHVTLNEARAKGLFASVPGSMRRFAQAMADAQRPQPWQPWEARSHAWSVSLRSVQKRLEKLFKKPSKHQAEIHQTIKQVHQFMSQDPLYQPYLFNELMDLSGIIQLRSKYTRQELTEVKILCRKVLHKVREMDRVLCVRNGTCEDEEAAA